ncbi:MAG TPA: RICIN domain-containing protein [Haloplasmataceae bacterium]
MYCNIVIRIQNDLIVNANSTERFYELMDFSDIIYDDMVEEYDYVELLDEDTSVFIEWLYTLGYDFNNPDEMLYVKNNLNKFILKAIKLNVIRDIFQRDDNSMIVPMFGGNQHYTIVDDSIQILNRDGLNNVYNFFVNNLYVEDSMDLVRNGSIDPDYDEKINGTHYYVYGRGGAQGYYKNNVLDGLDADYSISARTRFEEHYSTAISAYKNGKYSTAFNSFGRALHYLQDVASTPHAAGLIYKDDVPELIFPYYHNYYENWVALVYNTQYPRDSRYIATTATNYYQTILDYDNPSEIFNSLAQLSASFKDNLTAVKSDITDPNYEPYVETASACIPYVQQLTAALMYRFYEDVTNPNRYPHYIKDGSIYYLKNVGNGKYLDMESWGSDNGTQLQFYTFHGDTNQQFKVVMQEDGSFYFSPINANDNSKKITINSSVVLSTTGTKIKPVYYKNGNYRLMYESGDRNFKSILVPLDDIFDDRIVSANWNPNNNLHYWSFEEVVNCSIGSKQLSISQYESKRIIFTPSISRTYTFYTMGSTDTYFENLYYRVGTGNSNLYPVILTPDDDSGEALNAQYTAELVAGRTYILLLKCYGSKKGNSDFFINNFYPEVIQGQSSTRADTYTITDNGRFDNPYDTINIYQITGHTLSYYRNNYYSTMEITVHFTTWEKDDGYQYYFIYDGSTSPTNYIYEKKFEHYPGSKNSTPKNYTFTSTHSIYDINTDNLYIMYGASGSLADTWYNNNFYVTIKVY